MNFQPLITLAERFASQTVAAVHTWRFYRRFTAALIAPPARSPACT